MLFVLLHEMAHVAITEMGLPVLGRLPAATVQNVVGLALGPPPGEPRKTAPSAAWFTTVAS
jgi:hypothetical protein